MKDFSDWYIETADTTREALARCDEPKRVLHLSQFDDLQDLMDAIQENRLKGINVCGLLFSEAEHIIRNFMGEEGVQRFHEWYGDRRNDTFTLSST